MNIPQSAIDEARRMSEARAETARKEWIEERHPLDAATLTVAGVPFIVAYDPETWDYSAVGHVDGRPMVVTSRGLDALLDDIRREFRKREDG